MCGIAGYLGLHDPDLLAAMTSALAHRGPDDRGFWHDAASEVGLGHRRLSILDLSPRGRQPMTGEDRTIRVVFNGEIYNYRELREQLRANGHQFVSDTDTEVLVHLYEEEGEKMLGRLNGIYALAIWDARKHELMLARDPLGVKPLYYALIGEKLVFASELKAVVLAPIVPRTVDLRTLHDHLTFLWAPAPGTMFTHVRKLEPGAALTVAPGRPPRHWRHYELPAGKGPYIESEAEAALAVREHITQAVGRQLVSDVEVGAFLSGGIDSGAIVAAMRELNPKGRIRCYTAAPIPAATDEGFPDDLPYARSLARHLGVELVEVPFESDMIQWLQRMIYLLDEPQADTAPLAVHAIAQRARADGVRVLLSGTGGDDLFSGYRRHAALEAERLWDRLPAPVLRLLAKTARMLPGGPPAIRRLRKAFANADQTHQERLLGYFSWADEELRRGLYSESTRSALSEHRSFNEMRRSLESLPAGLSPLERMLYLETKYFLPDHNLNYTDKMSMAVGVEVRVPFLDLDLVRLAARIPPRLKQNGLTGKLVLRHAMEGRLPPEILHRPKAGFGAPLRRWVARDFAELIGDLLSAESISRRGWFDPTAVQRLIEANRRGAVDGAYLVFSLLCIETWARAFVDTPALEAAA